MEKTHQQVMFEKTPSVSKTSSCKKGPELGLEVSETDDTQSQLLELLNDSILPVTPAEFVRTCGEATTNVLSTIPKSGDDQANLVGTDRQETQTPLANQPLLFKTEHL